MDKISDQIDYHRTFAKSNVNWAFDKLQLLDPTSYGSTANEISEVINALEAALREAREIEKVNRERRI